MNEEFEKLEKIEDTSSTELKINPTESNPAVSVGSWLFAAISASFLIAIMVVSVVIPPPEIPAPMVGGTRVSAGMDIYRNEGCGECHSRHVRSVDLNYGSQATAQTMLDIGIEPGTLRIGPDLQNIAGHFSARELTVRLRDPQAQQPGTVMPSYSHLDENEMASLIEYLQNPVSTSTRWSSLKISGGIEEVVPDGIIRELENHFDPSTGSFISPVLANEIYITTGSGIFNSRCASCHGQDGKGFGIDIVSAPDDLTRVEIVGSSDIYLYWRISAGHPGSGMPGWRGTISEDGIWHVIGYIRSLESSETHYERVLYSQDVPPTEEEMMLFFPVWGNQNSETENTEELPGDIRDHGTPPDSASDEEGTGRGASDDSAGADESGPDPDAGEESP